MNRREIIMGGAAAAALLTIRPVLAGPEPSCWNAPTIDKPSRPERAVSLNRLLAEAASGQRPRLTGLTRIDGYVTEKDDVILWGRGDSKEPELLFDDLVVAVRSVRGTYGTLPAAVSLDWKHQPGLNQIESERRVVELLKQSFKAVNGRSSDNYTTHDALCREVAVFPSIDSMPSDSRTAKVLLDADYRLKLVDQGGASLKIRNPFKGQVELQADAARKGNVLTASAGRNWFQPGRTSYLKDDACVFFDCIQIVLREANAERSSPDPAARAFTCAWTNRMEEINRSEDIWRQMNNVFRHFALAKVLHENAAMSVLPNRLVLWRDYKLSSTSVPAQYPANIIHRVVKMPNGKIWQSHRCGGIELSGSPVRTPAIGTARADLHLAREKVLAAARSCTEACWNVI